jgi:adenosine deaminase
MRNIEMETVLKGIFLAMAEAERSSGISSRLIFCILRHVDIDNGLDTVTVAEHYRDKFKDVLIGVGLDPSEMGFPPHQYKDIFNRACGQLPTGRPCWRGRPSRLCLGSSRYIENKPARPRQPIAGR